MKSKFYPRVPIETLLPPGAESNVPVSDGAGSWASRPLTLTDVSDYASVLTQTTEVLHVYADGDSGNDSNDGLTPATPKKTLAAVRTLIPWMVLHNVCVHLTGTFNEPGLVYFECYLAAGTVFIIDGGTSLTTVADNAGSPWVADISSVSSLGLTTAGWTADQYAGYLLEMTTGLTAQTRLIQGHDATTITPVRNFSANPGVGTQFRIARPTTTIAASAANGGIYLVPQGRGLMILQNLYLTGTKSVVCVYNSSGQTPSLSHLVSDSSSSGGFAAASGGGIQSYAWRYNASTFAQESAVTSSCAGLSQRNASGMVVCYSNAPLTCSGAYIVTAIVTDAPTSSVSNGSRIKSLAYYRSGLARFDAAGGISNTSGYATTRLGGGTVGLSLTDSQLKVGAGVDISNCTSHAIQLLRSRLHLDGAVTGSGNTGAGVCAQGCSVVQVKDGAPPTVTGSVGNLSFDGTTQASTWSAIDGGSSAVDLNELSMCKEVA